MREYKFRAWDKRTRKMVETGFHVIGGITAFDLLYHYGMQHGKRKNEPGLLRMNSFVLMQFTGLKDKNGKDIYEGDIVQSEHFYPSEVKFQDGCFMAEDVPVGNIDLPYETNNWEVIGNIYENPELLEAVK